MIVAALPDPSQPSFVLFLAALGAFLGATVGRVRGLERDALRAIVENWTYSFTGVALLVYVVKLGLQ
ncbi:MAG: hypothetical protein QOI19_2767 [Thermoleophilaceae bacterium]|jgi:hypothetical protein|nr:hypothetical protein [Thermoleophilaceae bacterium]